MARALVAELDRDQRKAVEILSVWLDPAAEMSNVWRSVRTQPLLKLMALACMMGDRATAVAVDEALSSDAKANLYAVTPIGARACRAMLDGDAATLVGARTNLKRSVR